MKKFLALFLFLLFILFAWFGWQWYKNTILCCDDTVQKEIKEVKETVKPEVVKYGPLVFDWDSGKPITNDLWPDKKIEIQSADAEGKILRIVGPYYKDEINNTTFENLGLARADALKQMLSDSIPIDRMEIESKLMTDLADAKTKPFGGTILDWKIRNENIKEIDNKVLIYFPYNSSQKMENENITNYLNSVAESLKDNKKTLTLTGHTDNKGQPAYNKWLGEKRANAIKNILIKLGIGADRITVASQGEAQPIATNDTEDGMQKNRRVELEIK